MKDPESKTAFYHEVAKKLLHPSQKNSSVNNYIQAVAEKYHAANAGFDSGLSVNTVMQMEGIRRQPTQLKTGITAEKRPTARGSKKEDGMKQSQKLLLTWLIENTGLYP